MGTVVTRTEGPDEFVVGHDTAVLGLGGDDTLQAMGQNVVLVGNGGNDVLLGSAFSDVLGGSEGDNTLTGGAGQDIFVVAVPEEGERAQQTIVDFEVGGDRIGLPLGLTVDDVEVVTLREQVPVLLPVPDGAQTGVAVEGDREDEGGFTSVLDQEEQELPPPPTVEIRFTTQIRLRSTGAVLAVLPGIDGDRLTDNNFVLAETLSFGEAAFSVGEDGAPTGAITVNRSFPELSRLTQALSFDILIGQGDEEVRGDFGAERLRSSVLGGDRVLTVNLPLIDDEIREDNETFALTLVGDESRLRLGERTTTEVTVIDDDDGQPPTVPQPGTVGLSSPVVRVNESAVAAEVLVVRSGGSDGAVSVAVSVASGSAITGVDFLANPTPAVVTFGDGDAEPKTVRIPLLDDAVAEGVESFSVQLTNVTGGATLGTTTAAVNIVDQDQQPAGLVEFAAPNFSVVEGVPLVSVPVVRTGGSSGRVTINVAVNNGTAVEGADFRSPPGPIGLVFENGEVGPKEIVFAVTDDLAVETAETFSLALFNPVGGVALGANQSTTVTIQDNDQVPTAVDFSQAGNLEPFPVDPITGVRFSANVVGITNFAAGGSGNFVDPLLPPSTPAQAATYTGAGTILASVDGGFRDRLSFRYGAPFPVDPAVDPDGDGFHEVLIFDGPDGTGNVLAIAELPLTDDTLLPIGAFGLTSTPFEVRFNGVARSVAIGSQGDRIVIDDLAFG
ncbi:MAG: Calx-beta domain-containing protein [Cyanobacteria bacterium P01_C01_bin.89]